MEFEKVSHFKKNNNNYKNNLNDGNSISIMILSLLFVTFIICIYKMMEIGLIKGYQKIQNNMEYEPLLSFNSV